MATATGLVWQASLFDAVAPALDGGFDGLVRHRLDATAWADHVPAWLEGSDELFADLLADAPWEQRTRHVRGRRVDEARLTASWAVDAAPHEVVRHMAWALSDRYRVRFDTVGLQLYRDGRDSVAWHGDRMPEAIRQPKVALVSLGHPRTLRMRPVGGGPSRGVVLGRGDLFVMGGTSQRTWQHSVPKVARAGPRISLAFRHGA
jgi:alkylated DNA repair dioxygenase AlkB